MLWQVDGALLSEPDRTEASRCISWVLSAPSERLISFFLGEVPLDTEAGGVTLHVSQELIWLMSLDSNQHVLGSSITCGVDSFILLAPSAHANRIVVSQRSYGRKLLLMLRCYAQFAAQTNLPVGGQGRMETLT